MPEGWERVTYGEISTVNAANVPPSTPADHEITYLDIGSIPKLGIVAEPLERFRFADAPSRARRIVRDGDVVVSTVRPYLQAFALLKAPPPDLVASTGFAVLTPRARTSSEFLFQTVWSRSFLAQLTARMVGSNYPAVNNSDVADAMLLLPPLAEQRKIAAILSSVDGAIAATGNVIEQTKRMKRGLLKTLMACGIGHTRFRQTDIGRLPSSWYVLDIETVAEVAYGVTVNQARRRSAERLPLLTVAAHDPDEGWIADGIAEIGVLAGDRERYTAKAGDVLLIEGNGNPDLLGLPLIWDERIPGALHQNHLIRVRPQTVEPEWIAVALSCPAVRTQIRRQAKSSSGLYTINSTVVRQTRLPIPPADERRRILSVMDCYEGMIGKDSRVLSALSGLKRGLLQDLLTGRVRVHPD